MISSTTFWPEKARVRGLFVLRKFDFSLWFSRRARATGRKCVTLPGFREPRDPFTVTRWLACPLRKPHENPQARGYIITRRTDRPHFKPSRGFYFIIFSTSIDNYLIDSPKLPLKRIRIRISDREILKHSSTSKHLNSPFKCRRKKNSA